MEIIKTFSTGSDSDTYYLLKYFRKDGYPKLWIKSSQWYKDHKDDKDYKLNGQFGLKIVKGPFKSKDEASKAMKSLMSGPTGMRMRATYNK